MSREVLTNVLTSCVTVADVVDAAEKFGQLSRVVVDHDGLDPAGLPTCWITFQRKKDATQAAQELNGRTADGNRIAVLWDGRNLKSTVRPADESRREVNKRTE